MPLPTLVFRLHHRQRGDGNVFEITPWLSHHALLHVLPCMICTILRVPAVRVSSGHVQRGVLELGDCANRSDNCMRHRIVAADVASGNDNIWLKSRDIGNQRCVGSHDMTGIPQVEGGLVNVVEVVDEACIHTPQQISAKHNTSFLVNLQQVENNEQTLDIAELFSSQNVEKNRETYPNTRL